MGNFASDNRLVNGRVVPRDTRNPAGANPSLAENIRASIMLNSAEPRPRGAKGKGGRANRTTMRNSQQRKLWLYNNRMRR